MPSIFFRKEEVKSSAVNEELRIYAVLECTMFQTITKNRGREFTR